MQIQQPTEPRQWTLKQIQEALSRQLPPTMMATRKQGGKTIPFIPWHIANRILDKYCPGWCWEITRIVTSDEACAPPSGGRLFLTGRLTIPTSEGNIYREATGTELLACGSYGDPSSNAESMAFRRAAARFGLGLYLYDKD
jgi:hypothetical protein